MNAEKFLDVNVEIHIAFGYSSGDIANAGEAAMKVNGYVGALLWLVVLLCACTGEDGSTLFGAAGRLPDPIEWRIAPTPLTSEQWPRQTEVDELLVDQYRDLRIVQTTQDYSGDIIDWVDPDTIPGADVEPPPPPWTEEDLLPSPGAELARTELELYPELRGPEGTTPIHRPDFSTYVLGLTDATSLQDYLESYQVTGQPSGQKRLYAGLVKVVPKRRWPASSTSLQATSRRARSA